MSTTTAVKNTMLDAVTINKIRLHSGATTDGTQNVVQLVGDTNAEAAAAYGPAANGERDLSATVNIATIKATSVVSHFSIWNGTTYLGSKQFTSNSETYSNDGEANVTSAKITVADLA